MSIQLNRKANEIWFDESRFATDKRPWFGQLPKTEQDDFSFAVVGDRCGMAIEGVFEKALGLLADLKPSFIISVGDLIEGYWRDPKPVHEEWDEIDAKIEATGVPFFQVVGNHDYSNEMMQGVWRARKGFEYYAFRMNDVLFLVVNTEEPPSEFSDELIDLIKKATAKVKKEPDKAMEHLQEFYVELVGNLSPEQLQGMSKVEMGIGEEQLAFFKQVLENNSDVKRTFACMHKPGWKSDNPEFARLEQMLHGRPHTIFAGHFHALEYSEQEEGRHQQIQLGRTGGSPHGTNPCDENLILWVTMKSGVPAYRVIHLDGVTEIGNYSPQQHAHAKG
ncbi:metallophosphoesterase family protein [Cohnella herbarum]|uniref:Calcineurin-like phosphoesterase domain-containing protein n=1 Tax=Cohnella herbarum TaxID=2728023 RepID=A0A7Z2ZMW9_9BACL|nr:metallophosphoesterase [Cohnella herbarum]QJD85459.1 hypothetical protein HH215_21275 [Cohnella herbarum]